MKTPRRLALLVTLAATSCFAVPPDACTVVTIDEVNSIADGTASKISPRKSGNPSECAFEDSRRAAVLVLRIREVQYAAENELQYERENLEKIYRRKVKWIEGVGDRAFWLQANKTGMFRKGKLLVTIAFAREKNATEVDTMQVARLVESRLK
ncbi:MAG: hypothetical protein IPP91_00885 [Betaproteobacteria bacterium]|nr:hypothetical protein [Betaproteobacteria bacterium]